MSEFNNPQYQAFKEDVMKYGEITINELYILLNRVTNTSRKSFYGYGFNAQLTSRLRYYRHWIRMLESEKILIPIPEKLQTWEVDQTQHKESEATN